MTDTDTDRYLERPYRLEIAWSDVEPPDIPGWVANIYEFPGCQAQGDTPEELETNIRRAIEAWTDAELTAGRSVPEPGDRPKYNWTLLDEVNPLVIVQNAPGLATRYRELLLALSTATRPAVVAG